MKKFYTLLLVLFITNSTLAQSCLPEGIEFITQSQIDNFQNNYPGCTEIEGNVLIRGAGPDSLNGLSVLTHIGGELTIEDNSFLTSLNGLDNLTSVGGNLIIDNNDEFTNLSGLDNLTSVGGSLQISGSLSLTSLTGLEKLTTIGGSLQIGGMSGEYNHNLTSIASLSGLISIGGSLIIIQNYSLSSLSGLDNITVIPGHLDITASSLTNLAGLDNLTSVGLHLEITGNDDLTSFAGLNNLKSVGHDMHISGIALTSLSGLENLTSVGRRCFIGHSYYMTDLSGLDNLTSIGGLLSIFSNSGLISLAGLNNSTSIGGRLVIHDNFVLTSLSGLDNIDAGTFNELFISENASLSECEVLSICNFLTNPIDTVVINDNAAGCNSQEEVEEACPAGIGDNNNIINHITIYPTPSSSQITVELSETPHKKTIISFFSISGQELISQELVDSKTEIDISDLHTGIYIVKVWNDKQVMVRKVIKQ